MDRLQQLSMAMVTEAQRLLCVGRSAFPCGLWCTFLWWSLSQPPSSLPGCVPSPWSGSIHWRSLRYLSCPQHRTLRNEHEASVKGCCHLALFQSAHGWEVPIRCNSVQHRDCAPQLLSACGPACLHAVCDYGRVCFAGLDAQHTVRAVRELHGHCEARSSSCR